MSQAFVSSFTPITTSTTFRRSISPRSKSILPATTPTMQLQTKEKPSKEKVSFSRIAENRRAKLESEYRGPQGFTPYAEKVNGRMAMLGFFIGLVTEIFSGVPINEQMLIMFSPLINLVESIARIAH